MVGSATKTLVKKAELAIAAGDAESARLAVRKAIGQLDRAATKGVIHANAAARRKSRLVLKYNAAVAAIQASAAKADEPKRRSRSSRSTKEKKGEKKAKK